MRRNRQLAKLQIYLALHLMVVVGCFLNSLLCFADGTSLRLQCFLHLSPSFSIRNAANICIETKRHLLQNHFAHGSGQFRLKFHLFIVFFQQNIVVKTNPMKCNKSNGKRNRYYCLRNTTFHYVSSNIFRLFASFASFTTLKDSRATYFKGLRLQFDILWFYIAIALRSTFLTPFSKKDSSAHCSPIAKR